MIRVQLVKESSEEFGKTEGETSSVGIKLRPRLNNSLSRSQEKVSLVYENIASQNFVESLQILEKEGLISWVCIPHVIGKRQVELLSHFRNPIKVLSGENRKILVSIKRSFSQIAQINSKCISTSVSSFGS